LDTILYLAPIHIRPIHSAMNNLPTLPFRGEPFPAESFMGFTLRMSNLNGLNGLYWLYKLLGRERLNHLLSEDVPAVARLFGSSPHALLRCYVATDRSVGECSHTACGHFISRPYLLRHLRPQLCPACIFEFGYARSLWDFSLIGMCHHHQCMLIDQCPHCAKRIQWTRPSLQCCPCGFLWHRMALQPIDPRHPCLQFARSLDRQLQSSPEDASSKTDRITAFLACLTLDTAFRIIWIFGIRSSESDTVSTGISRTILRTHQACRITERAYMRLSHCLNTNLEPAHWIVREIHMPSLYKLARELENATDLQNIGFLLSRLGISTQRNQLRLARQFNQLTLF
jgi:hypothetical protein